MQQSTGHAGKKIRRLECKANFLIYIFVSKVWSYPSLRLQEWRLIWWTGVKTVHLLYMHKSIIELVMVISLIHAGWQLWCILCIYVNHFHALEISIPYHIRLLRKHSIIQTLWSHPLDGEFCAAVICILAEVVLDVYIFWESKVRYLDDEMNINPKIGSRRGKCSHFMLIPKIF